MSEAKGDILVRFSLGDRDSGIYDRTEEGGPRIIWEFKPGGLNLSPSELVDAGVDLARHLATSVTTVDLNLMNRVIRSKKDPLRKDNNLDESGQGTEERAEFLRVMSGDGGYVSQYIKTGEATI